MSDDLACMPCTQIPSCHSQTACLPTFVPEMQQRPLHLAHCWGASKLKLLSCATQAAVTATAAAAAAEAGTQRLTPHLCRALAVSWSCAWAWTPLRGVGLVSCPWTAASSAACLQLLCQHVLPSCGQALPPPPHHCWCPGLVRHRLQGMCDTTAANKPASTGMATCLTECLL
jgi:hypothetical protein